MGYKDKQERKWGDLSRVGIARGPEGGAAPRYVSKTTLRQYAQIYWYVRKYKEERGGMSPTVTEIAREIQVGTRRVYDLINDMSVAGLVAVYPPRNHIELPNEAYFGMDPPDYIRWATLETSAGVDLIVEERVIIQDGLPVIVKELRRE